MVTTANARKFWRKVLWRCADYGLTVSGRQSALRLPIANHRSVTPRWAEADETGLQPIAALVLQGQQWHCRPLLPFHWRRL